MVEERDAAIVQILGDPPSDIKQTDLVYETRDGAKVRAKLYQPLPAPQNPTPLVVIYHGGGFCVGSPEGEEQTCRNLVGVQSHMHICDISTGARTSFPCRNSRLLGRFEVGCWKC